MNLSFSQILILFILGFLFFSDTSYIIKNFNILIKKLKKIFIIKKNTIKKQKYNNRKKGI
jgi:hypothetical protein